MRWMLLLLALLFTTEAHATKRYALVVGSNRPDEANGAPLRYADDDAIAIDQLLRDAGVESRLLTTPDAETARLHPNLDVRSPTAHDLISAWTELLERMRATPEPTELLFFYSGHGGVAHGEGYVVLEDGRLFRSDLHRDILSVSPARVNHVIVDACKSYFMAFAKGPGGERRPHGQLLLDEGISANTGFVLSTSSGQDSHEWDRFQSGIFSHEVRSALRGAADVNGDGIISYAELGAFLERASSSIANTKYRPNFAVRPPGAHPGDLDQAVLEWAGAPDSVTLGEEARHVYVEGPLGERLADLHAREQQLVRLFLPEARPIFVRRADEQEEWVIDRRGPIDLASIEPKPASIVTKGARNLAFEQLFEPPFGASDVLSYASAYRAGPDPLLVEEPLPVEPYASVEPALGYGAIALALIGGAMTSWALERRYSGDELSFDDRRHRDVQIHRLNAAAISLYGAAALSAGAWLALRFDLFELGTTDEH